MSKVVNLLFIVWDMVSFDRIHRLGGTKDNLLKNHMVQQQIKDLTDCALCFLNDFIAALLTII